MIAIDEVRDYTGGEWRRPSSSSSSEVLNPATGEVIGHAPAGTATSQANPPASHTTVLYPGGASISRRTRSEFLSFDHLL